MEIAIVSVTGRDVGGVATLAARMCLAVNKIGHNCDMVLITRGNSLRRVFKLFGVDDSHIYQFGDVKEAAKHLNKYDFVVHEYPGAYGDMGFAKHNPSKIPWYHEVIGNIQVPQSAIIPDCETWSKWSPYFTLYENVCALFFFCKERLAQTYQQERGIIDGYPIDLPIDCSNIGNVNLNKSKLIASTHRIFPMKRYQHIVQAMKELPDWRLTINSKTSTFFYLKTIQTMIEDMTNVELNNESFERDLDEIYGDAALVYTATKFPEGDKGGMENVTLEAVVRGAVPLTTDDWCGWPDSPPEDAVYKFSIIDEKGNSNLVDIIRGIDPRSKEYADKQRRVMDFVIAMKGDVFVATDFVSVLREYS